MLLAAWQEPAVWPRLQGSALIADGAITFGSHPAPGLFGIGVEPPVDTTAMTWQCLRFATANVQSLEDPVSREGLHSYEGRVGLVRAQMAHRSVHVVAIQEARTERAETFLSGQYMRLCSGRTASGQLGVEIWLLREPQSDGVFFAAEDVVVTHFDPRLLCVRVTSPFLRAVVAAIHAPVATDAARDSWWLSLFATLKRVVADLPLVLLGDWNTRFATSLCSRVGDVVFPSRFPVSAHTWAILAHFDIWLPSTFSACHSGQSNTWFAPGSTASARLDYVGIPAQWQVGSAGSYVMADVDLGQRSLDHLAVCLEAWTVRGPGRRPQRTGPTFNRTAMASLEGQACIRDICQRAPSLPWALDASSHFAELESYFVRELRLAFPPQRRCRSDSFLTDATWTLRDHRLWLRRSACLYRARCRSPEVSAAFLAWRQDRALGSARLIVVASLCAGARNAAAAVQCLRATRLELRRCLRADKRAWFSDLARQAAASPVHDVVAKLRPLIQPRRQVQRWRRSLPVVRLEDGSLACNEAEALDRWVRHFAGNEGGTRCLPQSLLDNQRQELAAAAWEPFELQVGDLPTRSHLERAMARLTCGKAAGPDHLPAELLKFGSGIISRSIFPLFLKMVLRADEALQFKGGILHSAWKGRGSPSECTSHRALLVSSTVGKTLHSVLRSACVEPMVQAASPLQVGGLPRFPVQFPAHLVRIFQSWQRSGSHAILFLDLREAFYRVCRPYLQGGPVSDDTVARLFQQLLLPADVFQSFRDSLLRGSVLEHTAAPEWLQQTLRTVMQQTWFRLPQQTDVVRTTLGSRPGDCLADVLFYFVFSTVLHEVRDRVGLAGMLVSVAWCPQMHNNLFPPLRILPLRGCRCMMLRGWMTCLSSFGSGTLPLCCLGFPLSLACCWTAALAGDSCPTWIRGRRRLWSLV